MSSAYIQSEAKKNFKEWTKEGLEFLLSSEHQDIAINAYAKLLYLHDMIEFKYNDMYYEIFASVEDGYIVNVYSSDDRDEDGEYIEANLLDGGLCTGTVKDAIAFML